MSEEQTAVLDGPSKQMDRTLFNSLIMQFVNTYGLQQNNIPRYFE